MDNLKPVKELAFELSGINGKGWREKTAAALQADREAVAEACVDAFTRCGGDDFVGAHAVRAAILAVAKPPEDPRERLGRAVREAWVKWHDEKPHPKESWCITWEFLDEANKEMDRQIGDAVLAEQRKIEEEEDSDV